MARPHQGQIRCPVDLVLQIQMKERGPKVVLNLGQGLRSRATLMNWQGEGMGRWQRVVGLAQPFGLSLS